MSDMNFKRFYLFPYKLKIAGWLFLIAGLAFAIYRFYFGFKPECLNIKVFAVYSSFLQSKYFTFITNNISEEIVGLLILLGLFFIGFSEEKEESSAGMLIRYRSLFLSVYFNVLFLLVSFLFVFGLGFIKVLVLNVYSLLIIYIIIFNYFYHFRKPE